MRSVNSPPVKLNVKLLNTPLDISRKILVPKTVNMLQLHFIIQIAMGWRFMHLFEFTDHIKNPTLQATVKTNDAPAPAFTKTKLKSTQADKTNLKSDFIKSLHDKPFFYLYDFGDDWQHKISVLKTTKNEKSIFDGSPQVTHAKGACPPEDIGGIENYHRIIDILNHPDHPEYAETAEWMELSPHQTFNPDFVDVNLTNQKLSEYFHSKDWNITAKKYAEW